MDGYGIRFLSISPKDISASALGDLIKQYEIAVKSEYREATGKKPDMSGFVALSSIEDNCTTLKFVFAALLIGAGAKIAPIPKPNQIYSQRYTPATQGLYSQIYDMVSRYNTPVESYRYSPDNLMKREILSTVSPDDVSQNQIICFTSEKTIYGQVIAVGGVKPRIKIKTDEDDVILCDATKDIACRAAEYLYQPVKVTGEAKTNFSGGKYSVTDFKISSIDKFEQLSPIDLIDKLKPHISGRLDAIEDMDKYFLALREER